MKVLRWLLMLPAGLIASVILSMMVALFTKPLQVDTYYAATFCSYFAMTAVAAYVAPKHRLGALITGGLVTVVLLIAVVANSNGMGTARQRSKNPIARTALGLLGVAAGGVWAFRCLPEDKETIAEVVPA